jgi:adenylate cyclase
MTKRARAEGPSADEIKGQLERILSNPEFAVPERDRAFLRYVVSEALAGRADKLKAYCIATEVFARSEAFDAQNDPVVRIEAGRLRRALERYYLVAGGADDIVIDMPKGGYRPTFTRRGVKPTDADPVSASVPSPAIRGPPEPGHRFSWTSFMATIAGMLLIGVGVLAAAPATARLHSHALNLVASTCKHEMVRTLVCDRFGR